MSEESKGSFNKFFSEQMRELTTVSFPALKSFLKSGGNSRTDEDRVSDSASEAEQTLTPNGRSRQNSMDNTIIVDSLENIEDRLKVGNIILTSQLEQQTQQTQLLQRLAASGLGGGSGGGPGPNAPKLPDVPDNAVKDLWQAAKRAGKYIMGGTALGAAWEGGQWIGEHVVVPGLGGPKEGHNFLNDPHGLENIEKWIGDKLGLTTPSPQDKSKADNAALQTEISGLRADIDREKKHLALNPTDKTTLDVLKKLNDKLDADLAKQEQNQQQQNSTPKDNVPTTVNATTTTGPNPIRNGTAPDSANGMSPLEQLRGGIIGHDSEGKPLFAQPAGGSGGMTRGAARARASGGAAKGGHAGNQSEAWNFFRSKGYTDQETAAIMGNLQQESGFDPTANNPNDAGPGKPSEGIAQWNKKRRDDMMAFVSQQYSKPYNQLTNAEKYTGQLGFVDHELHTKEYAGALRELKSGQFRQFGKSYEGYGSPEWQGGAGTREDNAKRILTEGRGGGFNAQQPASSSGGGSGEAFTPLKDTGEVLEHIAKARSLNLINGDECVALAAGAVGVRLDHQHGIGSQVADWRRGASAADTRLPPGTPVATFHKRDGTIGDRYAEGSKTGGDPGADLDHAGVIVGYDKDGKGMTIADQYGAHGNHGNSRSMGHFTTHVTNDGMVTRKDGTKYYSREHDIHRYFGIDTEQGHLGGINNPRTPRLTNVAYRPEDDPRAKKWQRYDPLSSIIDPETAEFNKSMFDYPAAGKQGNKIGDTSPTVASQLIKQINQESLKQANADKQLTTVHVNGSQHNGPMWSHRPTDDNASDKVGSPNPPYERIKELWGQQFSSNKQF